FHGAKYKNEENKYKDFEEEKKLLEEEIADKKSKWKAGGDKLLRTSQEWKDRVRKAQEEKLVDLPEPLRTQMIELVVENAEHLHDDGAEFPQLKGILARHVIKPNPQWKAIQPYKTNPLDEIRTKFLLEEHIFENKIRPLDLSKEQPPPHTSPTLVADRKNHRTRR
ncbi:unnamed protein product, partial [Amoebophrya sp. A120]